MRRNFRKSSNYVDSKVITFSILGVVVLATVVFGILMYGKSLEDSVKNSQLSTEQIASITENNDNSEKTEDTESASTEIGKSVEEAEKSLENNEKNTIQNTSKDEKANEIKKENTQSVATKTENSNATNKSATTTAKTPQKETVVKKELVFQKPVEGEIMQNFAQDSLIFSKTLDEWVTHLGIDIKADKTTVVNSAEEGVVKSIKNDPRYGLTVVVSHQDGFETVYANLLSTEFVKEGDNVKKGQAIGTVGNTGVFESVEEPHLHFEILKDSVQVDPSIYIK